MEEGAQVIARTPPRGLHSQGLTPCTGPEGQPAASRSPGHIALRPLWRVVGAQRWPTLPWCWLPLLRDHLMLTPLLWQTVGFLIVWKHRHKLDEEMAALFPKLKVMRTGGLLALSFLLAFLCLAWFLTCSSAVRFIRCICHVWARMTGWIAPVGTTGGLRRSSRLTGALGCPLCRRQLWEGSGRHRFLPQPAASSGDPGAGFWAVHVAVGSAFQEVPSSVPLLSLRWH